MTPWAASIVHLKRIVAYGVEETLEMKKAPAFDAVLGFPDQLKVPNQYLSGYSRSFYPKRYGLSHLVKGIESQLDKAGVIVLTSTSIEKLNIDDGKVTSVSINVKNSTTDIEVSAVLWTSPPNILFSLLGLKQLRLPASTIPHRLVYLFLDRPPQSGKLYWFWSFDKNNHLVRVSSPSAYCPQAGINGCYPLCVETHIENPTMSDKNLITQVTHELNQIGVITKETTILGSWVSPHVKSFFVPTKESGKLLSDGLNTINRKKPTNLLLSSQNIGEGVFYLRDVLKTSQSILDNLTEKNR